jgi:hypothetical protein
MAFLTVAAREHRSYLPSCAVRYPSVKNEYYIFVIMEIDSSEQAGLALKLIGGPLAGKVVSARQNKVRIGRTRLSSLVVKDPSVSEKHAEIALVDGQWRIRDLGSTNGTFLNGVRVSGE